MNCPEDEDLLPPYVHQQPSQSNAQASQSNAQPSQSNGQPSQADEPNFEKGEILARLGSLMASIMVFIMDIGGYRYDPYFFTPALLAMQDSEQHYKEFLQFFARDFTIEEHAKDFEFCNRENKVQFAQRFFNHIAALQNVPGNIRALAAQFANGFRVRHTGCDINGFFKPCPLYTFVRTASLFIIVETEVFGVDMTKLELIIDFLLRDFDPKAYDIEDKTNVHEMVTVLAQGFGANNTQMVLPDGTTGRMRSRELLQLLAEHEAVPENVKQAAKDILPCF